MEDEKSNTRSMDRILKDIYYNAEHPASFGGVSKLAKASNISPQKTKKWLMTQDVYTLHKPIRFKFKRRKVLSFGIGDLIQCDLIEMLKYSKFNSGFRYILTAIDVFSKYAYAIPLKNKNAKTILEAFKNLFKKVKHKIRNLQTDKGTEFYNKLVSELFKKRGINHYSSHSEYKASVVERFNRTLKDKLFRIFTHRGSYKYIDVLDKVLKSYNNSIHRSIGLAPIQVTEEKESSIFRKLYGSKQKVQYKFDIGNQVRISKIAKTFRKGFLPNWSDEVFTIQKRFPSDPPTYILQDLKDESLVGRFYEQELQKVIKSAQDFWRIEKILKSRGRGQKKEYFVKWKGFDKRFNSWIKAEWMT